MDYLVYAYLQTGRNEEAAEVIQQLRNMPKANIADFKAQYASTAMPIRYAVERGEWAYAASMASPTNCPPHVAAIAVWARGLGLARSARAAETPAEIDTLRRIESQLRQSQTDYWATQVRILRLEIMAWSAHAYGKRDDAVALMREAADEEDAIEKLPVTPGPIIPGREQLGYLLLEENQPNLAANEFKTALTYAPGRRGALTGSSLATKHSNPQ